MDTKRRKNKQIVPQSARTFLLAGLFVLTALIWQAVPALAESETVAGAYNGYARYSWSDNEYYQGDFRNGVMDGMGVYLWPNGDRYTGRFVRGEKSGQGSFRWANGMVYTGSFQHDQLTGEGTMIWPNGEKYRGDVMDGQLTGHGTYTWPNGNSFTGSWLNGKRSGRGSYTWADGSTYEGDFVNDQLEGYGTMIWSSGDTYSGALVQGSLYGFGRLVPNNGIPKVGYWNQGKYDENISKLVATTTPKDYRLLSYDVTYQGKKYTIGPVNILESTAYMFQSMKTSNQRRPRIYSWAGQFPEVVATVYSQTYQQDLLLSPFVHYFEDIAYQEKLTDRQLAELTTAFVRSLPGAQEGVTVSFDEKVQYPVETLIRGGDSEDRSLLLAVLLNKLGFDTRLIYQNMSQPTHAAVAIGGDITFNGWNMYGRGKRYYYLETCAAGGGIGEISDTWKNYDAQLIPLAVNVEPNIRRVVSAK